MVWSSNDFLNGANGINEELIAFRRELHTYPELSFHEAETAGRVAVKLRQLGYSVRTGVGGHGIIADLVGTEPGRTIALRADMDALPIEEETGFEFASIRSGVMHACGHDAHTSMLVGAAKLLAQAQPTLAGTVRLLFQCAEEVGLGAQCLIDDGALDGVDEIYGLHNLPTLSAGRVGISSGPMMGSSDLIVIEVDGKGGHGAVPDQCVDPIVAGAAVVSALQTIVSREISPFEPVVVTIGSFVAGNAGNVIPGKALLQGTVRTFSPKVRQLLPEQLRRIVTEVANAHRCVGSLQFHERTPVLINDSSCANELGIVANEILGSDKRIDVDATMIGEDFACYLQHIPGSFFWLGSGPEQGAELAYSLHHPKLNINEACLPIGAAILAATAYRRSRL